MNVSIVFRNLAITLAGRAAFAWELAIVLSFLRCDILVIRKQIPAYRCDFNVFPGMNIKGSMWRISGSVAIRAGDHVHILRTAWTAAAVVALTYRAAHLNGFLRSDQQNRAAAPATTHPIIFMRSCSIINMNKAERLTKLHIPANRVSSNDPAKPITLIKVLDTIDFI